MNLRKLAQLCCVLVLAAACLVGQTVSSSITGTVLDPTSAVIPNATVTLTDQGTGNVRTGLTDSSGLFRFLNITPGSYRVSIESTGFKNLEQSNIQVATQETRDIGKLTLSIGSSSEKISVVAEAATIQLASSEKSQLVDGKQLNDITLKGRDLFGYLKLVPGVIDTNWNRNVTDPGAINNITINGNTSAKNFTVDGITDMDTGSNNTIHFQPNIDAIQELKVLTSNYQAEFGRNSGGTITVITKSGSQQFHGTAAWNHRHEGWNANTWANNRNGRNATTGAEVSPRTKYRFNVETYSIGGPVFIPKVFNTEKKKLFFFWSQEYTGQFVPGATQNRYVPTELERAGDFSQSRQNNGNVLPITDPTTGAQFPGNRIPASRIDPTGLAFLNYFPTPNFVGVGAQANVVNYFEAASAAHPRRNDVLRVDTYLTSKLSGYFRYINDYDNAVANYQGAQFTQTKGSVLASKNIPFLPPVDHPNPGHGYSASATYQISPTTINEFTVGKSWNTWSYYSQDNFASIDRSLVNNPPTLFPLPKTNPDGVSPTNGYHNLMPQFSFGSPPNNTMDFTKNSTSAGAYENFNTIWSFVENFSKVVGRHTVKAGFYLERNEKIQPGGGGYAGNYNFSQDVNNSLYNTGNGYANALLGYVNTYSQQTARAVFKTKYTNFEMYVQDNYRVNRKLTLDYGLRVYHQNPQSDVNGTFAIFDPATYQASAMPRIYRPILSGGRRVAVDPGTGAIGPAPYIGLFVPNTGNPASGMKLLDGKQNGREPYRQRSLAWAPRFGFAYDLSGDGKTAIRGGFGIFYNRLDGNQVYNLTGQAPYAFTPQVRYTTISQIAASGGSLVIGPSGPNTWPQTQVPFDRVHNASLEVQRALGSSTVLTVGYVGNWGYRQRLTFDQNPIPLGTRAPFNMANADPTNGNRSLPDIYLRTKFPGYNGINQQNFVGHTNYHALQTSFNRRFSRGLAWGLAYTWSKALGTTTFTPVVPDNEKWNYGYLGSDRTHNLQVSYSYDFPKLGKRVNSKLLGVFLDNWTLSGIFTMQSGAPFNPGGPNVAGTAPDYTGTPNVGARLLVVGDPMKDVPAGLYFNPAAFTVPAAGTTITTPVLGNLQGGAGVMRLPRVTNMDSTLAKFFPIFGERRGLKIQFQAYNVFNTALFNGVNTGMQWNAAGVMIPQPATGTFTGTLPARILALGARFEF